LKPLKTKKNPNAGWPEAGELFGSQPAEVLQPKAEKEKAWLAADLLAFLDPDDEEVAPLSVRAATGLLARLEKSQKDCPPDLLVALKDLAA